MPNFSVRVSPSQANDLAVVCALGPDRLRALADFIASQKVTIRQDVLGSLIVQSLGEGEDSEALKRVLFGLSSLSSRDFDGIPGVVESVTKTIQTKYGEDDRFTNWSSCTVELSNLLQTKSVFLTAKAIDVSYDFERVLTSSRILTSIRPIFDVGKDNIVGSTVVQTLRVEYVSSEGDQSSISFALDLADMANLLKACENGLKKARLAKETIEKEWSIDAIMTGEAAWYERNSST